MGGGAGPCPGSATTSNPLYRTNVRERLKCFFFMTKPYSMAVNEILVNWDPTLHMALHERIQEATQDGADLQGGQQSGYDHIVNNLNNGKRFS